MRARGLAALMYAKLNPHVSVTHVTFACSGALVKEGLFRPFPGPIPDDAHPIHPQADDLHAALGDRTADYLTLSFGGNDIGFASIVKAATTQGISGLRQAVNDVGRGFQQVKDQLSANVDNQLRPDTGPLRGTRIFVTEYPNPTNLWTVPAGLTGVKGQEWQNECGTRVGISFTPSPVASLLHWTITEPEIKLIDKEVWPSVWALPDLLARAFHGRAIRGIDAEFRSHGYCAPALSLPGSLVQWINTVYDSRVEDDWLTQHYGAMHPNIRGQDSFARHILARRLNVRDASRQRFGK